MRCELLWLTFSRERRLPFLSNPAIADRYAHPAKNAARRSKKGAGRARKEERGFTTEAPRAQRKARGDRE
jgi:hypothetical protein